MSFSVPLDPLRPDLFAPEHHWAEHFPGRAALDQELEVLDHLFPLSWRMETFGESQATTRRRGHPLRDELRGIVGCTRLLDIAAILRLLGAGPNPADPGAAWRIPLQGSLCYATLYEHAWSEALVGALLYPVGHVEPQPSRGRRGPRADYLVRHRTGRVVVEVKRVREGRTTRALRERRHAERFGQTGPTLTPQEHQDALARDVPRLRRRVHQAARQLAGSATAAREQAPHEGRVPGILFLDVDANPYLLGLRPDLHRWMERDWARSIDGIVAFNYRGQQNGTGTVAEAIYVRQRPESRAAVWAIFSAHPLCDPHNHIHVAGAPEGPCEFAIGL